ncbi:uncharacterized protein F5891DRAFT_990650 [Suillus fuscotomentosus]|uniref:Uncharacterized protein n=1 Tax=Suillus fuscotomentosus TaxID=1912939 RepID=A0AAD4DMS8_9AGAM|nr:uncharacterized protein F5891DRAFT_990650 [Suillus fuscotomentosus]KAG1883548.1 hypothetical protein F5891DRAFT_990650 [Suillus fuscotomentosus]
MTSDSDWDSRSMDSRPSDFNDGAEDILMNNSFKIEAQRGNEGDDQSRCSTPESHKDSCNGFGVGGQGAPVYSCGCYNYEETRRYKYPSPSHPDLETLNSGNHDHKNVDVLSSKRKIRDENDTPRSLFRDVTNAQVASVPASEPPPSKRKKLGTQSELFEGGLVQSLAKVTEEVAVMRKALGKIKEDLGRHSIILRAIHEVTQLDET